MLNISSNVLFSTYPLTPAPFPLHDKAKLMCHVTNVTIARQVSVHKSVSCCHEDLDRHVEKQVFVLPSD